MKHEKEARDVTINIHGRDYKIRSVHKPEYTRQLARYCDLIMKKIETGTESADYLKLTILAMLQVAHNYFQIEEGTSKPAPKVEAEVERLLKVMDDTDKQIAALQPRAAR
jgi:cell division protein ZapA (FtsZ GTPase activity inhibitor)